VQDELKNLDYSLKLIFESLPIDFTGQTEFTLSNTPSDPNKIFVFVNGLEQEGGEDKDYYIVGNKLYWTNRHFELEPTDVLEIKYFIV